MRRVSSCKRPADAPLSPCAFVCLQSLFPAVVSRYWPRRGRAVVCMRLSFYMSIWGCTPAAIKAARAVSGVQALASRSACSVVGRIIRWRSQCDVDAMRIFAGGQLGSWGRRRNGASEITVGDSWTCLAGPPGGTRPRTGTGALPSDCVRMGFAGRVELSSAASVWPPLSPLARPPACVSSPLPIFERRAHAASAFM